ncbi:ArsC family transcriptional regulator [Agaricicola taiwanensis]|uniref:ArsC family transcriptional regulator n=1 Tax=Agaricicola taiwanensis TaxID=591372 RepID=A0A8J2VJ57_9RHOB|nr:arsenate reductase ArsC [Agaricicola taiwanensis]GGE31657.1 ArsC family transcriptional regulator [Agaricicola taiwanensis]
MTDAGAKRPQSVLFMCRQNAIRSAMAEGLAKHYFGRSLYVQSAGVLPGEADGFAVACMEEAGLDISRHRPKSLEDIEDLGFDLIITLAPEAHHKALELTRHYAVEVEYWPTLDPTVETGHRDQRMAAYRQVRDMLKKRIMERFR